MKNLSFFEKLFGSFSTKELKKIQPIADRVLALEARYQAMTDRELELTAEEIRLVQQYDQAINNNGRHKNGVQNSDDTIVSRMRAGSTSVRTGSGRRRMRLIITIKFHLNTLLPV